MENRTAVLPNELLIDGEFLSVASGGEHEHVNPATGRGQRVLPMAGSAEIDRAVESARRALATWRLWDPIERRRVLQRFADMMRADVERLATIASLEMGGPVERTPFTMQWGIDWIEDAAGWSDRLVGEMRPVSSRGLLEYTSVEPVGVVAALSTWNGSTAAFTMSVAAPLAAGCTVVAKPSELAPFGALRTGAIALEAGIPPGVLNIVTAGLDASEALVNHPGIDKITFTGGPQAARAIAATAARRLTPAVFELGGKSACLVFDDADVDRAVTSSIQLLMQNAGQVCTLGSRVLVHESRRAELVDRLAAAASAVRQGDPFTPGIEMGPVINAGAVDRILGMVDRSREYGSVVAGGYRRDGDLADGFFVAPTVVEVPDNDCELARDEVFGPVLAVQSFTDEDEAIALANDSDFGLAGYVYTADVSRAHRVAAALDTGNVGINGGSAPAGPHIVFGGRRQSGYGKQGGLMGVTEFVSHKTVQLLL